MQIIVVSDHSAKTRTITLGPLQLASGAVALLLGALVIAGLLFVLTMRHATELRLPFVQDLALAVQQQEAARTETVMRENLNLMASKLGAMQAEVLRLDYLGKRLADLAGIKKQELFESGEGGPLVDTGPLSRDTLQREIEGLASRIDLRADALNVIESHLMARRVESELLPSLTPVQGVHWMGSPFGSRIDPITGLRARHEGIDFAAEKGTPVVASAGGVVVAAEYHHAYGNLIEVDHGNGFTSRYAHLSKRVAVEGQLVRRGDLIGRVGSTGRSTGPHLHFEVRYKGVAQNPRRFIRRDDNLASRS